MKIRLYKFADRPSIEMTEDVLQGLTEFGLVLKKIHMRLISEGYTIENGKIIPPKEEK